MWIRDSVQAAALLLANEGKTDAALAEIDNFHHQLCQIRILDPACGSANFLYVTLEHMKRLEGEILDFAHSIGGGQQRLELSLIHIFSPRSSSCRASAALLPGSISGSMPSISTLSRNRRKDWPASGSCCKNFSHLS